MIRSRALNASLSLALVSTLAACSSAGSSTTTAGSGGSGTTGVTTVSGTMATTATTSAGTGGASTTTFQYRPAWDGVTSVDVIGGFGTATDWDPKNPAVKLAKDASGTWTGTLELPPGKYPYLFHVVGDSAGMMMESRYAIDPNLSAFIACPSGSPSYTMKNANPCSQLSVPQGAPDSTQHVKGKVTYSGAPIAGYLAEIERDEPMSHHYFADRVDTAADGSFDLTVAPGNYRIQILYPDFLTKTDADRNPFMLKALRRAISASFDTSMPMTLPTVEMAFDYSSFKPTAAAATLPTTFTFTIPQEAGKERAAVYGTPTGMGKSIGDPWFASPYGTTTSVPFDGTFNTMQATETQVKSGESYFWGTWVEMGTMWNGESMVLPITWN